MQENVTAREEANSTPVSVLIKWLVGLSEMMSEVISGRKISCG